MFELQPHLRAAMSGDPDFRAVLWEVGGLEKSRVDPALWLAPEELVEMEALRGEKRRREWLAARVALKGLLLADGVVAAPATAIVRKDAAGAPRLVVYEPDTGRYEVRGCSISHSGAYVLCAYTPGRHGRVGVDIERRTWRMLYLRRKYANKADRLLDPPDSIGAGTLVWSLKESLSKLVGTGMGCGFPKLVCNETEPGRCEMFDPAGAPHRGRYEWLERYALTAVADPPDAAAAPAPPPRRGLLERLARKRRLKRLRRERAMREREAAKETAGAPEGAPAGDWCNREESNLHASRH